MSSKWTEATAAKHHHTLDLEPGLFTWSDPAKIAKSLKHSSDVSKKRTGTSLQSAMSMLNFYINRAGSQLSKERLKVLNQAKEELRKLYEK